MERQPPAGSESLVEAAALGDVDAFAAIMAAHDGDMTRVCMVICGDVDTARQAVQSAWPIVWRRLGSLRDADRLRSWLMSVAANEARQWMRAERRRARRELLTGASSTVDLADRADQLDVVAAVSRLPLDDRRLVALRYAAGLTSAEIADVHGVSPSAIRGRLARILAGLRKDLGDD